MTTAHPLTDLPTRTSSGNRILNVIRMQFINTQTFVWVPLSVLGGTIVISLAIFAMIPTDEPMWGGGAQAPMWYFAVIGVQALTLTFPFSQAMSVTRREFYLGTLAAAAVSAAGLATAFVLIGLFELATDGYGINGYVAHLPWLWEPGIWAAWLTYFTVMMFVFVVGFWAATIYKRWGTMVLTIVLMAIGLALVGLGFLITRMEWWGSVFQWFGESGPVLLTLYGLALTVILAGGSSLTLRRAVA
ncbi:hypothetical protein [Microbacterium sp. G2-8]|uniref:hypothetical protein n=1 Tax=Microbacterium sp. G2-8 TaxID=2842454 RepID=UPI001C891818|nr:hypothetical protein [Microbacterium sp. G2-8]